MNLVVANPDSGLYHNYYSYQGTILRKTNLDGSLGIIMTEPEAIAAGYEKSDASNS